MKLDEFIDHIKKKKLKSTDHKATDPKFWKAILEETGKCNG